MWGIARFTVLSLAFFLGIASLVIPFLGDGIYLGHDIYAHLSYAKFFHNAFIFGQIPVRWIEWAQPGYSQPLFNYYQVGFYYLFSLIHLYFPFIFSIKLAVAMLWGLGGIFIFLLTKRLGYLSGLFAFIIYMFSPYVLLDIFVRAAFPELMALSLMPAIFWSINRVILKTSWSYIIFLSFFLGFSLISHLPSVVIFAPILISYSLLFVIHENKYWKILDLIFACFLGLGVAAFYLGPSLLELDLIQIGRLTSADFDFHKHFISLDNIYTFIWGYNQSWMVPSISYPFILGLTQWFIWAGSFVMLLLKRIKKEKYLALFWIVGLFYSLFFASRFSSIFWENMFFLEFIQFPWRFFMIVPISSAILGAVFLNTLEKGHLKIILVLLALVFNLWIYHGYLQDRKVIDVAYYNLDYAAWLKDDRATQNAYYEPGYNPVGVEKIPGWGWEKYQTQGLVEELYGRDNRRIFVVDLKEAENFVVNTHYFPKWRVMVNGEKVIPRSTNGYYFLSFDLDAGRSIVEIYLEDTWVRRISNYISSVSLGSIGSIMVFLIGKKLYRVFRNHRSGSIFDSDIR